MKYVSITIAVLIIAVVTFAVINKVSPVGWGMWGATHTRSGVALDGYDPVSYFAGDAPQKGRDDITHTWRYAEWHFASAANRERFAADPGRYAPQFGGFCAFAVSKGFTASPSPEVWRLEDGTLYLFANAKVRDQWVADLPNGSLRHSREKWEQRGRR